MAREEGADRQGKYTSGDNAKSAGELPGTEGEDSMDGEDAESANYERDWEAQRKGADSEKVGADAEGVDIADEMDAGTKCGI